MSGFCPICGDELGAGMQCPNAAKHEMLERTGRTTALVLPRAPGSSRLMGAGLEFFLYELLVGAICVVSFVTGGVGDFVFGVGLLLLIGIRDSNAGRFSLEKRMAGLRVVKTGSGRAISNVEGLKRNAYYLLLPLASIFAFIGIDQVLMAIFQVFVVLDVMMIMTRRDGRRLGDLMAGTQVVPAAEERGA